MAVYASTISLKRKMAFGVKYQTDPCVVEIMNSVYKELEFFQHFLERLDSRARKRMSGSLEEVSEAIRKFEKNELDPVSIMEILKMVREDYHNETGSKSKRVGLSDVWTKLKEDLLVPHIWNGVFHTLSLVGMAGVGKTALARQVFQDLDIVEWFDCRVWVTVGVEWKPEDITRAILAQVDNGAGQLKESLTDKRFLIVLDDVWKDNVNEYLESSLPDSKNGSRVLLTTRNRTVGGFPIDVRLLNKEESWQLLCDRVFGERSCPPQLEKAGKKVAEKCDGLPLTIVTVADLLSKAEEPPESLWLDVATKKKHQVFVESYERISEVLYPSYTELNDIYKPCFLYMGLFPLKSEIRGSKLINLWITEDILNNLGIDGTLEFYGALMLNYFYLRGLVMVHQRSTGLTSSMTSRGIKTCGLHSSWWHFCQIEARETEEFHVLDCLDDAFEEGIQSQELLSIHNNVLLALKDVYDSIEENCASTAQTVLCFGPYSQYMVPICFGLKLLQILDALNIRFYDFPLEVLELVKLRYLALTCNGEVPSTISKLGELQYLIVHRHFIIKSCGAPSYLPMEIWDMKDLKYLHVMGRDLPDIGDTSLPKLTTLLGVSASSCNVLRRVSNIKNLGIRIELESDDVGKPLCWFDQISQPSKLESLKCVVVNPIYKIHFRSFPCLPISLKKLSLCGLGYPWEEMSKIASLPNLETLKLRYNAFRGMTWEVEQINGFPKLHLLQIEDIHDLVKLKFRCGTFKCLVVLKIKHCYNLQQLHFGDHRTVSEIEVDDCNPLVEMYIKLIVTKQAGLSAVNMFDVHSSWKS